MSELSGKLQQRLGVGDTPQMAMDGQYVPPAEPRVDTRHLNAMLAIGMQDGREAGYQDGASQARAFAVAERGRMARALVSEALDLVAGEIREKLDGVRGQVGRQTTRAAIVDMHEAELSALAADLRAVANEVRAGRVDLG